MTETNNTINKLIDRKNVFDFVEKGLSGSNLELENISDKEKYLNTVKKLIYNINFDDSSTIHDLLLWAKNNKHLKAVETAISPNIVKKDAAMFDVRVQSRGPDDIVFDQNSDIRAKIARGNCILKQGDQYELIIYALRKFTGGLGDEDEMDRNKNDWKNYFLKDIKTTTYLVSMEKANGEAAHFSCRYIDGDFLICAGSKNVHLVFRRPDQIDQYYSEERYSYARKISHAVWKNLERLDAELRNILLSFLCWTKLTIIFEILIPTSQHVVDLSYLKEPLLIFITFTESKLYEKPTSLCCMPPELSIEIAKLFDFSCVKWSKVLYSDVENHLVKVRKDFGYEGVVLYFIDADFNVIGLLKKKTTWYIIIRAIREKLRGFLSKNSAQSVEDLEKRMDGRLVSIKNWIGFSDDDLKKWKILSKKFIQWFDMNLKSNAITREDYAERFPVVWNKFLCETLETDKIEINISNENDLKDGE